MFDFYTTSEAILIWNVFVFLFGLCVGSFLNVCIWRMPRHETVITTPSHCPNCNYKIKWYENIPIVSWLILRGRCSNCKEKISPWYLFIEILTAVIIFAAWQRIIKYDLPLSLFLFYLVGICLFIVTFFVDLKHKIIPNTLNYTVIITSFILAAIFPLGMGKLTVLEALMNSILGAIAAGGIFTIVLMLGKLVFRKDALGWGDVKFISAVGACFGLYPPVWFFCILVGSVMGTIIGVVMILIGKGKLTTALPFGSLLSVAGILWILWGAELTNWYFSLFIN